MRKKLSSFWENYKYRFVPWIIYNLKQKKPEQSLKKSVDSTEVSAFKHEPARPLTKEPSPGTSSPEHNDMKNSNVQSGINPLIIHHVRKEEEKLISDDALLDLLIRLFEAFQKTAKSLRADEVSKASHEVMQSVLGYSIERRKSLVAEDAGTGVFLKSGHAPPGSLIALYPGTIYLPSEPLFFPSIGNPFIFRCSDGVHIDGNDKWISKSIYKSCSARDKFREDLPCCDESWLTPHPQNPLNIGQYVNNRSKSSENNVVYQESSIIIEGSKRTTSSATTREFPIHLCKYLSNVWANPENNHLPLKLVPLVAVKDIKEGDEILSSYFTILHSSQEEKETGKNI